MWALNLEYPQGTRKRAAERCFSVNVWAGIVGDHLIGPYFLPVRLDARTYLIFLLQVLPELIEEVHVLQSLRHSMCFQHDGASQLHRRRPPTPKRNIWTVLDG